MNLPQNLKYFRTKNNFSQNDLAEKLNISRQAVSRWETGKTEPDLNTIKIMAELYGITVDELLEGCNIGDRNDAPIREFESMEAVIGLIILFLASQFALTGILVSAYILLKYNKKHSRFLKILSVVCMLYCLYKMGVYIHCMSFQGTGTVEAL